MDSSLKKRLITAICGVPLLIIVLLSPLWVVTAAVIAVSLIGLYEYFRAVGLTSHPYMCILGYIGSVIIALGANFSASASLLVMYLYVIILFLFMIFNKESVSLIHIALLAFGLIYIPYFLSNIIYIRMTEHGKVFIWLVFIGAMPASFIVLVVMTAIWFGKLWQFLSVSGLIWSIVTTIFLILNKPNFWFVFIVGAVAQILVILWYLYKRHLSINFKFKD